MNPAVTARCFLLISFGSIMTNFSVDGISSATPLAAMRSGEIINISKLYLGYTDGVIGGSALALLLGGLLLWCAGGITMEIPLSVAAVF